MPALQTDNYQQTSDLEAAPQSQARATIGVLWVLEYIAWLLVILFLAGVFAVAVLSPVLAAPINAEARGESEAGFGRIVIDFEKLPHFEQELASGIFVVKFDESVKVDLAPVKEALPKYIGLARLDPDGKALRFALSRTFEINVMEAGNELFIDLLPPDWQGLPPPLPEATVKALTRKALQSERERAEREEQRKAALIPFKLTVKVARHPTFLRIVFDWNKFVEANLTRNGGWVELTFDKSAEANFTQLRIDPPKFLKAIDAVRSDDEMTVQLSIDDDVDVRGFREGNGYVLDLTPPDALTDISIAKLSSQLGSKKNTDTALANASPSDTSKEAVLLAGRRGEPAASKSRGEQDVTAVVKDLDPAELSERSFDSLKNKPPEFDGRPDANPKAPKAEQAKPVVTPAKPAMNTVAGDVKPVAPDVNKVAKVNGPDGVFRHTFQFSDRVSAAVFRRGRSVWLVFDSNEEIDVAPLREAGGPLIEDIRKFAFGKAQYVRIRLAKPRLVNVSASSNGWHLAVGDLADGSTETLRLARALRDDKRSLIKVKLQNAGRVHWITDPDIGDRLAVVTAFAPQRSIAKPQEFVDFSAYSTAHGIAIRPRTDDVAVRLYLDDVLITRRQGLTLSAGNAGQYDAGRKPLREAARVGFIDYKKWTVTEPSVLSEAISQLQRDISNAPQKKMNALRFDLATLYMTNSFHAEALGLLRRMESADNDVTLDPAYRSLRGATLVMMNRLEEANRDFAVHALVNDADASLWRSQIAVKEQRWADALYQFMNGADRLGAYRSDMHALFRLGAIRAGLESDRLSETAEIINAFPRNSLPESIHAEFSVLKGRYLDGVGRNDEAADSYDLAMQSRHEPAAAEASLHSIMLRQKTGQLDRTEALKGLERLQLFWRGDDIELRTLRSMASLYAQEQRFRDAFSVMRNSIDAFPKDPIALRIQDDMRTVFKDLFLHDGSNNMKPVEALSLFYGYRELTPVGRLGDEMIRRLATRLVKVDLLDQASELLDHQVKNRLNGAARAQVATRLAMVHLMNHKPDQALRIVRQTRQAGLPDDLQRSRNMLEARALSELGRAAAAVEILNTMDGESVERLKADAYWSGRDWENAGKQIEKMLGDRWSTADELTKEERTYVLRAAVAFSLAEDQFALDRLRKKYYPKLVKSPEAGSFLVVTKPIKDKDVTFRNLAKEIASVDTLDAFIKEFKAGYDAEGGGKQASDTAEQGKSS